MGDIFYGVVMVVCSCVGCADWLVGREWVDSGSTLGLMDLGCHVV